MAELAFHAPSDSVEAERRWKQVPLPGLNLSCQARMISAWQQLIRHVAAMITVVVVAPSRLRKFLPGWKPLLSGTPSRLFVPSMLREFPGRWNPLDLFNHRG